MLLTNAQRGDLIDALKVAIDSYTSWIEGETLEGRLTPTSELTAEDLREMRDQIKRWRMLRRQYLAEERALPPARVRKVARHGR